VINLNTKTKKKNFINSLLLIISLAIVVVICMIILDTTGKLNQGNFRVNDLVVSSTAEVLDTKAQPKDADSTVQIYEPVEVPIESLSDLRLDVSQKNAISFLIAKSNGAEANEIYIDNIKINYPKLTENMLIYQKEENKIDLKTANIKLPLEKQDKDGQYLIKINIDNINCIKETVIPETELSIVFDGTIFNILNTKISDISFDIQFNLNVVDSKGKTNICKIKLFLPNQLLVTNGVCIINENAGDFPFKIK